MRGKSILLYSNDKTCWRRLGVPLTSAGNEVIRVGERDAAFDLVAAKAVDLVFIDTDCVPALDQILAVCRDRLPVIAISRKPAESAVLQLVCRRNVHNLIAWQNDRDGRIEVDVAEAVVTSEKILRRDLFGIGKYLSGFGVEICSQVVSRASDRDVVVEKVQSYLRGMRAPGRLIRSMGLVVDELVTNAVYNAPRESGGQARYAHLSRRDKVDLEAHEYVQVEFGSNGRIFAVAVTDNFGALSAEKIRQGLGRSRESPVGDQGAAGAGIGLHMVLRSCDQFVVNIEPKSRTQMLALAKLQRQSDGGGRRGGHSFHCFIAEALGAAWARSSEATVELSEELRQDLREYVLRSRRDRRSAIPPHEGEPLAAEEPLPDLDDTVAQSRMAGGGGLHTTLARLRGAPSADRAFATAMQFLARRWHGAVLFEVAGESVVPLASTGAVAHWNELKNLTVYLHYSKLFSRLVGTTRLFLGRLEGAEVDQLLAGLIVGRRAPVAILMGIPVNDEIRYILCGSGRDAAALENINYSALRRELTRSLQRLGQVHGLPSAAHRRREADAAQGATNRSVPARPVTGEPSAARAE